MLLALGTFLLACGYAGLLFFIHQGWRQLPAVPDFIPTDDRPFISVIIAARNEGRSIFTTLHSLSLQQYPNDRYEIIVIDDHSEDDTAHILQAASQKNPNLHFFSLAEHLPQDHQTIAYKKAALQLGIEQARGDFIVTTDADCLFPSAWLKSYAHGFREGALMVLGPVQLQGDDRFLDHFQALDVAGTMILTGAAVGWGHPLLANGANMGFERQFFYQLGGYAGNEHRASGDDIFLLQKAVRQAPERIGYLAHSKAVVVTEAVASWSALFRQRLRWAAKTSAYKDHLLILFQGFVYLFCCLLLLAPFVWWVNASLTVGFLLLGAWLVKLIADYFFLRYACRFFKEPKWMKSFLPAQFTHVLYIVLIGTLALFPVRIRWKDRPTR